MANQSLYRARIVLAAWDSQRNDNARPSQHLIEAFLPAVRLHLRDAYGWFLLSVSGMEEGGAQRPVESVQALPTPEAGRMQAPELAEFAKLEAKGWIGEMLQDDVAPVQATARAPANLLVSDRRAPDLAVAERWADSLDALMTRMDDSLAEC